MVDVVVNNVMATSTNPDYSKFMFKDKVRDSWPQCPPFSHVNPCPAVQVSPILSHRLGE